MIEGILIIDKPEGITSHDVVNRVRRVFKTRRVGHTGTLDPFATGVMVVLLGKATRLAQFLDKDEKEYEAVIRFGFETDTGDRTGAATDVESKQQSGVDVSHELGPVDWEDVLSHFRGEIGQMPPMYSAKKIAGKKLYEHARKGIEVERERARVRIKELQVIDAEHLVCPEPTLTIRVVCSAGTYIRVLAEDIGRYIGVGAHLAELRRTRSGRFNIEIASSLEELAEMDDPKKALLLIELAVEHLPAFALSTGRVEKTINGLSTRVSEAYADGTGPVRMIDEDGGLVAIGTYDAATTSIRPKVVLV